MKTDPVKSLMEMYAIRELELYKKFGEESEDNFYDDSLMHTYVRFPDFTASITRIDDKNDPYKLKPTREIRLFAKEAKLTLEYNHKCPAQLAAIEDRLTSLIEELKEQTSRIISLSCLLTLAPEYIFHGSEIRNTSIALNADLDALIRDHIPFITNMDYAVEVYNLIHHVVPAYVDKLNGIIPKDNKTIKPLVEGLSKILNGEK